MAKEPREDGRKWLVSDEACAGCKYYRALTSGTKPMACHYMFDTGSMRKNPPAECEVKEIGCVETPFNRKGVDFGGNHNRGSDNAVTDPAGGNLGDVRRDCALDAEQGRN